jgi:hypothetical protein
MQFYKKIRKSRKNTVKVQFIINSQSLFRIALAQETGLSPGTVSSLIGKLLEEGALVESGLTLSTGGRGRKDIKVNSDYGLIAVVKIGRQRSGCLRHWAAQ